MRADLSFHTLGALLVCLLSFNINAAQSFESFITSLEETALVNRQQKIDRFMASQNSFPLIEDGKAHFVYSGPLDSISIAGDFTGWNPRKGVMTPIEGSNFWYRTFSFNNAARVQYKVVSKNSDWFFDPLNPLKSSDGNNNSELRMPHYSESLIIQERTSQNKGTVTAYNISSEYLKMSRDYFVYTPPQYNRSNAAYPLLVVNDGKAYLNQGKISNVLDNLISDKTIKPIVAVFVPPVNRTPEYVDDHQDAYTNFVIKEIIPTVRKAYNISEQLEDCAIIGSSYGGNISFWIGMKHPEIFGNIGGFSPYLEKEILDFFSSNTALDTKIYINHGIYDHLKPIHESVKTILPILVEKNYVYEYAQYPESHNYGFWRAHLEDVLRFFFSTH